MFLILTFLMVGCVAFRIRQRLHVEKHQRLIRSQLRQALENMVHALRIGVGFVQALEYAAKEGAEPLASHWRRALDSFRLGKSLEASLSVLAEEIPIKEMEWFVAAVQITHQSGGSLSDVLDTLAMTLRERELLREKVSALTAQGKASGILLSILPYLMMAALYLVVPELARPLFMTWKGQAIIAGVTISIVLGGLVMKKIVDIRVD